MEEHTETTATETLGNTECEIVVLDKYRISDAEKLLVSLNSYRENPQVSEDEHNDSQAVDARKHQDIEAHIKNLMKTFSWPEGYEAARIIFMKTNPSELEVFYMWRFLTWKSIYHFSSMLKTIRDVKVLTKKAISISSLTFFDVYFSLLVAVYLDKCSAGLYLSVCIDNAVKLLLDISDTTEKDMLISLLSDVIISESSENSKDIMHLLYMSANDFTQGSEKHIRALKLVMEVSIQVVAKARFMIKELKAFNEN